jgi:hypothetical protein
MIIIGYQKIMSFLFPKLTLTKEEFILKPKLIKYYKGGMPSGKTLTCLCLPLRIHFFSFPPAKGRAP